MVDQMECTFVVKEGPHGEPFIVPEPRGRATGVFSQGLLLLVLRKSATLAQAEETVQLLNRSVAALVYTELRQT